MIREWLGFDLSDYNDGNMTRGLVYGSLGAVADALPWYLAALSLPVVARGGDGLTVALVVLCIGIAGFAFGLVTKKRALCGNFDGTYAMISHARLRLANHLAKLPLGRILSQRDGALAELLTSQFTIYQDVVTQVWGTVISGTMFPVLLWFLLVWFNWAAACIILAVLPIAMLTVPAAYRLMDRAAEKIAGSRQQTAVNVLEVVSGNRDLLFFDPLRQREGTTIRSLADYRDESMRTEIAPAPAVSLFSLIVYAGTALGICAVSYQFSGTDMDPLEYFLCLVLTMRLGAACSEFGLFLTEMRFAISIIRRLRRVLDEPVMPWLRDGAIPDSCDVRLQNVCFGYGREEVLHSVSLTVPAGTMAALVGPSGSGKSTLAALVARLWDVDQGVIRIGGRDIRDIDEQTFNRTVSMVLQDVTLFPMSIADNIRLGRRDASLDEVITAAQAACIHERIMELPKGYDTILESGDVVLSGGERQRIAIARAILKDAPVLILDEATASLDLENEHAVQLALSNLCRNRTTIVIAHKLWTIQDASCICVLDKGVVAEQGTHDELMARNGLYRRLWDSQRG